MNTLPICILNYIFNFLDFKCKLRLRQVCKRFRLKIKIKNIPDRYLAHLTTDILKQDAYSDLEILGYCENVENIEFLHKLEVLTLNKHYTVEMIANLKLRKVETTFRHAALTKYPETLQHLHTALSQPITNETLTNLNLKCLKVYGETVTKIKHMTNLRKLICCRSGIKNEEIRDLKLTYLNCTFCPDITEIPATVQQLYCGLQSGISDKSLSFGKTSKNSNIAERSKSLTKLDMLCNNNITDLRNMTNLTYLDCSHTAISHTVLPASLETLHCIHCSNITEISHLTNLTTLVCYNCDLHHLPNSLKTLICGNCPNITEISHLTNLRHLECRGRCGITNAAILKLLSLFEENETLFIDHQGNENVNLDAPEFDPYLHLFKN